MRVVAYSIVEFEKKLLVKANAKVHNLTLISNELNFNTIHYAEGKEVIIVSERDHLDRSLLYALREIGVKKIITRSTSLDHIDVSYACALKLHVANSSSKDISFENMALQTINNLNSWMSNKCLEPSCYCTFKCERKNE